MVIKFHLYELFNWRGGSFKKKLIKIVVFLDLEIFQWRQTRTRVRGYFSTTLTLVRYYSTPTNRIRFSLLICFREIRPYKKNDNIRAERFRTRTYSKIYIYYIISTYPKHRLEYVKKTRHRLKPPCTMPGSYTYKNTVGNGNIRKKTKGKSISRFKRTSPNKRNEANEGKKRRKKIRTVHNTTRWNISLST